MGVLLVAGRVLMLLSNVNCSITPFLFDWNETHVKNPRWPPHARFHNGQTMTVGLLLGIASTVFLFRDGSGSDSGLVKDHLTTAALFNSMYWVAGLSAILYPGAGWIDPEHQHKYKITQKPVFAGYLAATWVGYLLAIKGIEG